MNNEELKKKICDIIAPYVSAWGDDERIANALIAAGIGDVKEAKFESDHYWRMWQGALVELERAEHRAEVAEKAFLKLVHEMYEHGIRPMCDEKFFVESRLKDAEKELEEEREFIKKWNTRVEVK